MSTIQVRSYAIGRYRPDGTRIEKRKRIVMKPYRTQKRKFIEKRKEVRTTLAFFLIGTIMSLTFGLMEKNNRIDIVVADTSADVAIEEATDYIPMEAITADMTVEEIAPVKELSVEEQIRAIAKEKNFRWEDYLVKLADCESKLNPLNKNTKGNTPAGSLDRGLFQINNYWHKEVSDACAYDVRCATEWTIKMVENGKQGQWACNRIILNK